MEARAAGRIAPPPPDLVKDALAPAARGELPVIVRADAEDDIRGAVKFAQDRGLKLILAGGLEAWRCADLLRDRKVPVLLKVLRLPARRLGPLRCRLRERGRARPRGCPPSRS